MAGEGRKAKRTSDGRTKEALPRKAKEPHPHDMQHHEALPKGEDKPKWITMRKRLTPEARENGWRRHKWAPGSPPVVQNILPYNDVKPDESRWKNFQNRPLEEFVIQPLDVNFDNDCGDPEDFFQKAWRNDPENRFAAVFRSRKKLDMNFRSCYEGIAVAEPVKWRKSSTNDIYVNCAYCNETPKVHSNDILAQSDASKTEQLLYGSSKKPTLQDLQNCFTYVANREDTVLYGPLAPLHHPEKLQAFGSLDIVKMRTFLDTEEVMEKYGEKMPGINDPTCIIAPAGTITVPHHEDGCFASINSMLSETGEKIFVVVHGTLYNYRRFVSALAYDASAADFGEFITGEENAYPCMEVLMRKILSTDIKYLVTRSIDFSLIIQRPGHVVALGSLAVHGIINISANVTVAKNFVGSDYVNVPLPACVPQRYCGNHVERPIKISQADVHKFYTERRKAGHRVQPDAASGSKAELSEQWTNDEASGCNHENPLDHRAQPVDRGHYLQRAKVKKNRPNPSVRRRIRMRLGNEGAPQQLSSLAGSRNHPQLSRMDSLAAFPVPRSQEFAEKAPYPAYGHRRNKATVDLQQLHTRSVQMVVTFAGNFGPVGHDGFEWFRRSLERILQRQGGGQVLGTRLVKGQIQILAEDSEAVKDIIQWCSVIRWPVNENKMLSFEATLAGEKSTPKEKRFEYSFLLRCGRLPFQTSELWDLYDKIRQQKGNPVGLPPQCHWALIKSMNKFNDYGNTWGLHVVINVDEQSHQWLQNLRAGMAYYGGANPLKFRLSEWSLRWRKERVSKRMMHM